MDRDEDHRRRLAELVERELARRQVTASIDFFPTGADLPEKIDDAADILLLYVGGREADNLEIIRRIRTVDSRLQLLLMADTAEPAVEGYEVEAADFLLRPVTAQALERGLDRAFARLERNRAAFLITKQGKMPLCISTREIVYIESLNKKTIIHKRGGERRGCSESLRTLEKKLPRTAFYRCHNAFLVNLDCIWEVYGSSALVWGAAVPVSKYRKRELLDILSRRGPE